MCARANMDTAMEDDNELRPPMAPGMDELVFRASERLDVIHTHLVASAIHAKEYVLHLQELILETWNNPVLQESLERAAENAREMSARLAAGAQEAWERAGIHRLPSPAELFQNIHALFTDRVWRKTVLVFVCGAACGGVLGVTLGFHWGSRNIAVPHFRALHSLQDGSAVVVEDGAGACVQSAGDVVIRIHAFSVQPLDRDTLKGRARSLRDIVKPKNKDVTIGRSFSGVVVEMGPNVTRLDIGDEVWGALAEWEGGAAQELVCAPARRVGRVPRTLPPEAAASLPHFGAQALYHLHNMGLSAHTAKGRKVLIIGAGSGPGCIMLQLLKAWGALTTAVCDSRARPLVTALGAQEVVTVDWCDEHNAGDARSANPALAEALATELGARGGWDAACICRAPPLDARAWATVHADLRPPMLMTDRLPRLFTAIYGLYVTSRRMFAWARGLHTDADFLLPAPFDAEMLDRLASHVEAGNLQTVVDKVYALHDFELALAHACSVGAIGCTVVRMS